MEIYKGKILRKKERKHAYDQEKNKIQKKKERKRANDQVRNQDLDHTMTK